MSDRIIEHHVRVISGQCQLAWRVRIPEGIEAVTAAKHVGIESTPLGNMIYRILALAVTHVSCCTHN